MDPQFLALSFDPTGISWSQDKTKKYDGFFEIQGLSDENDVDEIDIEITTKDTTNEGYKVGVNYSVYCSVIDGSATKLHALQ